MDNCASGNRSPSPASQVVRESIVKMSQANRSTYPILRKQSGQFAGEPGQGIEQVRQAHEIVIAFQGIPVFGKEMFVGVPLVFLYQESGFDAPAITRTQISASVDVELIDVTTGDSGMAHLFGDELSAFPINFLPLFMAGA